MLIEKYRPRSLDGIVGHPQIVRELRSFIRERGFIPNLLFHGPAGVGKTATALALGNEVNCKLLKFNASKDRRLKDMRDKIIKAMKTRCIEGKKIIVLDEAGELTTNAQRSLKRPLDPDQPYSPNFSAIFITNHLEKIDPPISSRCYRYHFEELSSESIKKRIAYIAEEENLSLSQEDLSKIARRANGDMREAIQGLWRHKTKPKDTTEQMTITI